MLTWTPIGFRKQDPVPPGALLDELVEDWQTHLSKAIISLVPFSPSYQIGSLVLSTAEEEEQELRELERRWLRSPNKNILWVVYEDL